MSTCTPLDGHSRFMGRIDDRNPEEPVLIWPLSSVTLRFRGTAAAALLRNHAHWDRQYIGWIVDGDTKGMALLHPDDQLRRYTLAENLADGEHEITLYKRMAATGTIGFGGWQLEGEALSAPAAPRRRIECYGDSVSTGEVVDAAGWEAQPDPPHEHQWDDAWRSYIAVTARNLGAELHDCSQGGIALLDGTGYYLLGMESCWDKLNFLPALGLSSWDFSRWTPHVVVLAIGQNDPHPDNDIAADPARRQRWVRRYTRWLGELREKYPKALFVVSTTILQHSLVWEDALDEACAAAADTRVVRFRYTRCAAGTPGHPRASEHMEMARELTAFLESFGEALWQ